MRVFVLSSDRQPLDPCHPARARKLLDSGKARVFRVYPFTIILQERTAAESVTHPCRVKIDPGSRTTGMAVVQEVTGRVVVAVEIQHRGILIRDLLTKRRAVRRSRRQRKTRYRPARFQNRTRRQGWLPPSLESRVANVQTWVRRLCKICPVEAISVELVRFDMQVIQNPDVEGIEYQRGELYGAELREYLLEKWGRKCAYCGKTDVPLQVEHIHARSTGGSDRVSNLTLACEPCNTRKGNRLVEDFLKTKPDVLASILAHAKAPLRDAAAVNTTRWELWRRLVATGLPVETGSGGRTKFNRTQRGLPKAHWLDATCVGTSTQEVLLLRGIRLLLVQATGHGRRQMCLMDRHGFPRSVAKSARVVNGFRTGDMVRAVVPVGKYAGRHYGRVAVRATGWFNVSTDNGVIHGVNSMYCTVTHRCDGYSYSNQS